MLNVEFKDDATMAYCKAHNVTYQAYSPLCGGETDPYCAECWSLTAASDPCCSSCSDSLIPGANGSSCEYHGGVSVMGLAPVQTIAKAHKVSAAQVGLKFVIQLGHPLTTAIWKRDYMLEDLDLWSWGNLTAAEMATLRAIKPPNR